MCRSTFGLCLLLVASGCASRLHVPNEWAKELQVRALKHWRGTAPRAAVVEWQAPEVVADRDRSWRPWGLTFDDIRLPQVVTDCDEWKRLWDLTHDDIEAPHVDFDRYLIWVEVSDSADPNNRGYSFKVESGGTLVPSVMTTCIEGATSVIAQVDFYRIKRRGLTQIAYRGQLYEIE